MDNNNPIEYNNQNKGKWIKFGFFSGDTYLVYVFNKTEKISAALYVVSGLLKDSEPLKWELREKSVMMLSTVLSLNGIEPIDKGASVQTLLTSFLETNTLLNVALVGGLISHMNYEILVREIDQLVDLIRERIAEDTNRAGYVLSDAFFKTDELIAKPQQNQMKTQRNPGIMSSTNDPIKDKKNNRQEQILSLLKQSSNLTIRDFVKVVVGCSEKTIQRELIELVERGVVIKAGERRWSRYSLK
jgi:hypothetical protein